MVKYAGKIRSKPRSMDICRLVGHRAARSRVIGREERPATGEELARMSAICAKAMEEGAFGLSSGLEYLGDYVTTEEVAALARAVAPGGGYYETHLRNEDVDTFAAFDEAVQICRDGGNIPLCVSHIKVSMAPMLGRAGELVERMRAQRAAGLAVYANWRPSICWSSDLKSLDVGGKGDPEAITAEVKKYWRDGAAYCHKCPSKPQLVGRTLSELAAEWKVSLGAALMKVWEEAPDVRFEFAAMAWADKRTFLEDPFVMVASDGWEGDERVDPMSWSCFPIFFATMIREWKWLPMEEAVRRCTSLPASMVGLSDRGVLKSGMKADVVVFDPQTIAGHPHWDTAATPPEGIAYTIVNGVVVMDHGAHTGAFPGRFISKAD
jgi:N-acyl-D-amino-acid deacylase